MYNLDKMIFIRLFLITILFLSAGCSGGVSSNEVLKENVIREVSTDSVENVDRVVIKDYRFLPQRIVVKVGTTVSFVNDDKLTHTVSPVSRDEVFGGTLLSNQILKHTFSRTGKYPYRCDLHSFMNGVVEVVD